MSGKVYSPEELGQLLVEFNQGTPLSELEIILGRTISGIVRKMLVLSKQDPKTWNPEKVSEYRNEWQRQYNEQHKDERKEWQRRYYVQHKGERKEWQRKYYKQHKDEKREWQRQYDEQKRGKWKEFGNYLGQLLEGFNGSKKEAAGELGISPSLLSHYLAGNRKPNEELLIKVSKKFNVSYEMLENKVGR